jgi:hypothetical protein
LRLLHPIFEVSSLKSTDIAEASAFKVIGYASALTAGDHQNMRFLSRVS